MIVAYAQVAPRNAIQVWVGIFGKENPAQPTLDTGGHGHPSVLSPIRPIRDGVTNAAGQPLNHRSILQVTGLPAGAVLQGEVRAGDETRTMPCRVLPDALPQKLDGTFNILLCSCYSQPEDASGLTGSVVSQIKLDPTMTMMLGDQIYGDLPIFEDLPEDPVGIARKLGMKYYRNWASSELEVGGLTRVLSRAPVVCVADDHEFWNNFPFGQRQLPMSWTGEGRELWRKAAQELYEDYQLDGPAGGAKCIEVDPLKILIVDMRTLRDDQFNELVPDATVQQIAAWEKALVDERRAGRPAFGLLSSGQALFVRAADESARKKIDAEMSNYAQFHTLVVPTLERLSAEGIPVIYVTGDVHWGRVAQGRDVRSDRWTMYEVIASPSRLIRVPALDRLKETLAGFKGLFGKANAWPRHSEAPTVPKRLGESGRFQLECDLASKRGYGRQGDQVAVMSFSRAGGGIDFNVTYYAITDNRALGKSESTTTYELRNV